MRGGCSHGMYVCMHTVAGAEGADTRTHTGVVAPNPSSGLLLFPT